METYENESIYPDPAQVDTVDNILIESHKYTASKLGLNIVFILVIAFFFGLLSLGIDSLARSRMNDDLLSKGTQEIMSRIFSYGIYFNCVSLISVFFVEAFCRRKVNYFQYVLIGGSLCVSFLMLVAFSEKMNFVGAYSIITLLTTVQVSLFVYGLTKVLKAAQIIGLIFFCEYLFMLMMAHLQPIALLVGSITLFVLISLAMYLSVKLASGNWHQLQ